MDNSWKVPSTKPVEETEPVLEKHVASPHHIVIPKRVLAWGLLGLLFFGIYTGGTYYVLFMRQDVPLRKIPHIPTAGPKPSITPLPTPTAVPTPQQTEQNSTVWIQYVNETYGVSLMYPPNMVINFNKTETGIDPFLILISYPDATISGELKIDIQDSRYLGQSDVTSRAIIDLELQGFAQKKWDLNKAYTDLTIPTRRVGELELLTFNEQPAYSFTVFGSYADDRTYLKVDSEKTYLFTENKSKKIIISYPTADATLQQIVQTIILQ